MRPSNAGVVSLFCRGVIAAFFVVAVSTPALAQDKGCFLVVMHGKWGNPQYISAFGRKMDAVCSHKSIEMPWSLRRNYDQPYPKALEEIQAEVRKARDAGYSKVVLAGHSFGANAALAYMAEIGDVDGVIALAPGHSPSHMYEQGIGREAVETAIGPHVRRGVVDLLQPQRMGSHARHSCALQKAGAFCVGDWHQRPTVQGRICICLRPSPYPSQKPLPGA
jgi:pimeloyl-ACP methyl ester carboxylesterase